MGALLGLSLGIGLLLISLGWFGDHGPVSSRLADGYFTRLAKQSAIPRLSGVSLFMACVVLATFTGVLTLLITAVPTAAFIAFFASGGIPVLLIRRHVQHHKKALRKAWPDAVDSLLSAVRAGLALPEAVAGLALKGPVVLRPAFEEFSANYRAAGSFGEALVELAHHLADPVADRVIAVLRIAREVGGNDLGSVLGTLSAILREDARMRGEIEARQSWTVNSARLAVAAPWLTLALLSTRPEAVQAYNSAAGAAVLFVAFALSFIAYRVMIRIGRMPDEQRLVKT
jgi:tight adherence protein B